MVSVQMVLCIFVSAILLMLGSASKEPSDTPVVRQLPPQNPLLPPSFGGAIGNILPAILPVILILGLGAFLLPAIGILLFGSAGGLGGVFDGFSKKRSFNMKNNPIFSPEKMIELLQTVTKAIEEASKET